MSAEAEGATVSNIRRKEADADRLAAAMVKPMADLSSAAIKGSARDTPKYNPSILVILPKFMEASACLAMLSASIRSFLPIMQSIRAILVRSSAQRSDAHQSDLQQLRRDTVA